MELPGAACGDPPSASLDVGGTEGVYEPGVDPSVPCASGNPCVCCLEWTTTNLVGGYPVDIYIEVTECFIKARASINDGMGGIVAEWSSAETPFADPGNLSGFKCNGDSGGLSVTLIMQRLDDPSSTFTLTLLACGASPCPDDWPSMEVSVFKAGYTGTGGGNIVWLDKTWTPLEVENGVTKTVCPTDYAIIPGPSPSHHWRFSASPTPVQAGGLKLNRSYDTGFNFAFAQVILTTGFDTNSLYAFGLNFNNSSVAQSTSRIFSNQPLTGITFTDLTHATPGNYLITPAFFGSHTTGFGLTYTWAKGAGWP